MINEVLVVLRDRLEDVLQASQSQSDRWVVLAGVGTRTGADPAATNNKLILSLVNLQSDATTNTFVPPAMVDDQYFGSPPPLNIEALILISANFDEHNYEAGLARLSAVIAFLQSSPVLTRESAPQLPRGIDRLMIDFVSLDLAQVSSLMLATGAKYAPFALYRLRRLPFSAAAGAGVAPMVSGGRTAGGMLPAH
jgi:hypothetical protein